MLFEISDVFKIPLAQIPKSILLCFGVFSKHFQSVVCLLSLVVWQQSHVLVSYPNLCL